MASFLKNVATRTSFACKNGPYRRSLAAARFIRHTSTRRIHGFVMIETPSARLSSLLHPVGFRTSCQTRRSLLKLPVVSWHTTRGIRISRTRHAHPLFVLLVLKPLSRFAAAATGWLLKRWWRGLPSERKKGIWSHLKRFRVMYACGLLLLLGSGVALYQNHVTTNPYTGRRRFMIFTPAQMRVLGQVKYTKLVLQDFADKVLAPGHPLVEQVKRVTDRLLQANSDLPQVFHRSWTVTVIHDSDECNCMVLQNGDIVMFTGMMDILETEDQLAHVLAHEISHVVLEHTAEDQSFTYVMAAGLMLPFALLWFVLPSDVVAAVAHWVFSKITDISVTLPHSRQLEDEADAFGLKLAAKACYDVRASSLTWGLMALQEELEGEASSAWLSTHPSHAQRQENIDAYVQDALLIRATCQCPPLPAEDPREFLWVLQKYLSTGGSPEKLASILEKAELSVKVAKEKGKKEEEEETEKVETEGKEEDKETGKDGMGEVKEKKKEETEVKAT